jgi:menaquinone-dependent protoporphyrinogen oxidase
MMEAAVNGSVLVAYATRYGSTQEVAEAVAGALGEQWVDVQVKPLREVHSLDGYTGVVMGAPLQMFKWHKDALGFLTRFQTVLANLPVAVFALGPFNDVEKEWTEIRGQLDKELAKFPWFRPLDVRVFGGKFDPVTLRFPYNLVPGLKKLPATDIRDWEAIKAWGSELAGKMKPTDGWS